MANFTDIFIEFTYCTIAVPNFTGRRQTLTKLGSSYCPKSYGKWFRENYFEEIAVGCRATSGAIFHSLYHPFKVGRRHFKKKKSFQGLSILAKIETSMYRPSPERR